MFLDLAENRCSVREFSERAVEQDVIEQILRAGLVAPTACNRQPQRVYVLSSEDALARLRKCTMSHFHAPLALLVCYDKTECWQREYDGKPSGDIDASIVCTHMMLAAADLGVGSTWVMHYIPEAVREEFALQDTLESTAILVMGYPKDGYIPSPMHGKNKPLEETVRFL